MSNEQKKFHSGANSPQAAAIADSPEMLAMYNTIMAVLATIGGDSMEALISWGPDDAHKSPYLIQIHVQPISEEDIPLLHQRMGIPMKKDDKDKL